MKKSIVKITLFSLMVAFGTYNTNAQDSALPAVADSLKMQTLFSREKNKIRKFGLYVAPEVQYAALAGSYAWGSGASAKLIFNQKWSIGVSGMRTERVLSKLANNDSLNASAGFGGLVLEYTLKPNSLVHVTFPLTIGAGSMRFDSLGNSGFRDRRDRYTPYPDGGKNHADGFDGAGRRSAFFFVQPAVQVEVNAFRALKFFGGVGYRIALGNNSSVTYPTANAATTAVTNAQLSGLSAQVGMKIGFTDLSRDSFKRKRKKHDHSKMQDN
jgi:hypothetical protein